MWSQDLYRKALIFASHAHMGQTVPGTSLPYIIHCVNVCNETLHAALMRNEADADLCVACSLLHDTIEDTETTAGLLQEKFGDRVMSGVMALTKNKEIEKEKRMTDSLNRIKQQPREVWMVKMADRIVNLALPPRDWTKEKIKSYREEALLIYETLKDADNNLASRLLLKIEEYRQYTV